MGVSMNLLISTYTIPVYKNQIYIQFNPSQSWNFQILLMVAPGRFEDITSQCGADLLMIAKNEMKKEIDHLMEVQRKAS